MTESTDFIAAAKAKSQQDKDDLQRAVKTDRTARFFATDSFGLQSLFEGMFLAFLLALVPFLAFAGLAIWSFGAWSDHDGAPWIFAGLSVAIPILVLVLALKSKSDTSASILADMMGAFWTGVFPYILVGCLIVFAIATWLGVSFQVALGLLVIVGILLFALANQ